MIDSRIKKILFPLVALTTGILVLFLILEICLKIFPVNEGLASRPVNDANPVLSFRPNRTSTWSKGWNFSIVNEVHSNNYGFICDHDFDPDDRSPLLAVVGDSYVEATMVPFGKSVAGRLASRVRGGGRVYPFASSGSPLSQYLVYAEFARDHFRPDGLVVVVVGNDFDESLLSPGSPAGYHYFREGDEGLETVRLDLEYGLMRRLLRHSDLLMYAVVNLELTGLPDRLGQAGGDFAGNTRRAASPERLAASEVVAEAFLERLPAAAGLPAGNILLVLDGIRPDLYEPDARAMAEESYWGGMRRRFTRQAENAGFEVLDMEPVFRKRFDRDGVRFEFESDAHWNGYAHGLVAETVMASSLWSRVFGDSGKLDETRARKYDFRYSSELRRY